MCLMSKLSFLIQGLKWDQRQGQTAQESGEGQFHIAEGECFLPDHGPQHTQHNPSTHPVPVSASVPERSTHLAKGKQASWVGSMASRRHGKCPFSIGSPAA